MSRLASMSPAALRAAFAPESDEFLITLLTISEYDNTGNVLRIADGYTGRLAAYTTDAEVVYGVTSRGSDYIFLPVNISLPSEEEGGIPKCSISITDVTKQLMPIIQSQIVRPPKLLLELVLNSSPNTVEASFPGFYINSITYTAESVQLDVSMINYQVEPFPCFGFTPKYFPGLF